MTNCNINSEPNEIPKESTNWKHFGIFYLFQIILITVTYWVGRNVNQNTTEMLYLNIPAFLGPPIISGLMICTYKGLIRLSFTQKLIPLIGLLAVNFIWTLLLNYFNVFNRSITQQDILEGIQRTGIYELLMLIICLPIIGLIKTRIKTFTKNC